MDSSDDDDSSDDVRGGGASAVCEGDIGDDGREEHSRSADVLLCDAEATAGNGLHLNSNSFNGDVSIGEEDVSFDLVDQLRHDQIGCDFAATQHISQAAEEAVEGTVATSTGEEDCSRTKHDDGDDGPATGGDDDDDGAIISISNFNNTDTRVDASSTPVPCFNDMHVLHDSPFPSSVPSKEAVSLLDGVVGHEGIQHSLCEAGRIHTGTDTVTGTETSIVMDTGINIVISGSDADTPSSPGEYHGPQEDTMTCIGGFITTEISTSAPELNSHGPVNLYKCPRDMKRILYRIRRSIKTRMRNTKPNDGTSTRTDGNPRPTDRSDSTTTAVVATGQVSNGRSTQLPDPAEATGQVSDGRSTQLPDPAEATGVDDMLSTAASSTNAADDSFSTMAVGAKDSFPSTVATGYSTSSHHSGISDDVIHENSTGQSRHRTQYIIADVNNGEYDLSESLNVNYRTPFGYCRKSDGRRRRRRRRRTSKRRRRRRRRRRRKRSAAPAEGDIRGAHHH